ncbi:MAG: amidohydrolase family protein [Candidatus Binatia bacterium]
MLGNLRVYDADAHVILAPQMWEDLPEKYVSRRPRPAMINDAGDIGAYTSGWLVEGKLEPHVLGPGLQPANTPAWLVEGKHRDTHTLVNPEGRIRELDQMGIDVQFLFPSTIYARMTADPGFEAAMYRAYNRYMGRQCRVNPKRLKWAGLVPLRNPREATAALEEMLALGASAAVVFGTAREKMLSDADFADFWNEFARCGLPLCVHMGASYPPFDELVQTFLDAHALSMALPAQMAFVALMGQGMLDRYPDMKVAFMEFGAEWLFYMAGRMDHYLDRDRTIQPRVLADKMPIRAVRDYLKSGRIFVSGEMDDPLMKEEIALLGEDQLLFSSDYPHGEARENAAENLLERKDLTVDQKRKILYDNPVHFFGEP